MQKIQYTPAEEQELMAAIWSPEIVDSCLNFVMFMYPWGKQGTPLERFKGPRKWQVKVLKQIDNHIQAGRFLQAYRVFKKAISSGRGSGKSALVAWLNHWFVSTRIGGTAIVSANRETQLRANTFGEITKWITMSLNSHWWEIVGITVNPAKWLTELVEQELKIGTRQWGIEGRLWSEENPDAYAGPHNYLGMMVTFDEDSAIPDSIHTVAQGFFTEEILDRFWFLFGNMRRTEGYFYEAVFGVKREFWDSDVIDTRTVEGTDKAVYQEIIDEYGVDSSEARVEVYGLPPHQGDEQFISHRVIEEASTRVLPDDLTAPLIMGIDPSRGKDNFEVGIRQGRKLIVHRRFSINTEDDAIGTMEGVGHIIDMWNEFDPDLVAIDETGLGGPIKDRIVEQRYKIRGVNFAWAASKPNRWGNKRAEIWGELRQWLATASIPNDKRLKVDLGAPRKKPRSDGVMFLESKADMRSRGAASPNGGDMLAVTFAYKVANRKYTEKRKGLQRNDSTPEYPVNWMGA